MLLTRDPPQNKGHIQTENEGLEKNELLILITTWMYLKWFLISKRSKSQKTHTYYVIPFTCLSGTNQISITRS